MYAERRQLAELERHTPAVQTQQPRPVLSALLPLLALVIVGMAFILDVL